jgi:hypothetical protein
VRSLTKGFCTASEQGVRLHGAIIRCWTRHRLLLARVVRLCFAAWVILHGDGWKVRRPDAITVHPPPPSARRVNCLWALNVREIIRKFRFAGRLPASINDSRQNGFRDSSRTEDGQWKNGESVTYKVFFGEQDLYRPVIGEGHFSHQHTPVLCDESNGPVDGGSYKPSTVWKFSEREIALCIALGLLDYGAIGRTKLLYHLRIFSGADEPDPFSIKGSRRYHSDSVSRAGNEATSLLPEKTLSRDAVFATLRVGFKFVIVQFRRLHRHHRPLNSTASGKERHAECYHSRCSCPDCRHSLCIPRAGLSLQLPESGEFTSDCEAGETNAIRCS